MLSIHSLSIKNITMLSEWAIKTLATMLASRKVHDTISEFIFRASKHQ